MSPVVSALFVCHGSAYKAMPGVEDYGLPFRDARTFKGGTSVVAHPPCRSWGILKAFAKPAPGERWLAVWSVHQVRRNGGVLEHPQASTLWQKMRLPLPYEEPDQWGGWTMEIDQFHFGHKARKRTWLYVVGTTDVPLMPYRAGAPSHVVGTSKAQRRAGGPRPKKVKGWCTKSEREQSPPKFAEWLVELARRCAKTNTQTNPQ